MKKTIMLIAVLGGLALTALTANANTITPTPILTPTPGVWTYQLDLTSGDLVAGDGFTIYDFGGYVIGSIVAPAGWSAVITPPALLGGFGADPTGDNASNFNLTWTYTGMTIHQATGSTIFTGFMATTTQTTTTIDGWASQDHLLTAGPPGTGGLSTASGNILCPSPVPDGGSAVALLGIALAGIGCLRRKFKTA
jgi:VPDSG-CTERM motif